MTDDQRQAGRLAAIRLCEAFGFDGAVHVLRSGKDDIISINGPACRDSRDAREEAISALQEAVEEGYPALYIDQQPEVDAEWAGSFLPEDAPDIHGDLSALESASLRYP